MHEMMTSIYQAILDIEKSNLGGVVCTVITTKGSTPRHQGSKMVVYPNGKIIGTVGGGEVENRVIAEAMKSMNTGTNRVLSYDMVNPDNGDPGICGGHVDVLLEPILPKPILVVIGAGHVGKTVAFLGKWLNFTVFVSDDREQFCNAQENPYADGYFPCNMADLSNMLEITPNMYIVLTTRGMNVDVEGLPSLLKTNAAYIGLIGSKRRWTMTRKALLATPDISEEMLDRIHSPIGLELNAETPEEIAVSILAEIIMLRNGGTGNNMKMS
jgi:xanthine dehydrogenase accessory factor